MSNCGRSLEEQILEHCRGDGCSVPALLVQHLMPEPQQSYLEHRRSVRAAVLALRRIGKLRYGGGGVLTTTVRFL
jgi:hypothetical protein